MRASAGDRLIIKGHAVGDRDRDAEILEARGPDGSPPFVVRWEDTGHETLFFPGSDATVQHFGDGEPVALPTRTASDVIRSEHHHLLSGVQRLLDAADALDEGDSLPDVVHEALAFLTEELLPHAHAEDGTLYQAIDELVGGNATGPMRRQHVEVDRLVARLERLRDDAMTGLTPDLRRNLRQVLHALHAILALHLATEEELYVPILESRLDPRRSASLADDLVAAQSQPSPPAVPG